MIIGKNFAVGSDDKPGARSFFRIHAEKAACIYGGRDKYSCIARRFVDVDIVLLVSGKAGRLRRGRFAPQAAGGTHGAQHLTHVPARSPGDIDKTGSQDGGPEKGSQHSHD